MTCNGELNEKINEIIGDAKTIGIAGHIRPDGDCVGSCMALYNYLKKNRPDLTVQVYLESVDDKFKIIKNTEDISTEGYDGTVYDLFISLDTASLDRLGQNQGFLIMQKEQPVSTIIKVIRLMVTTTIFCLMQVLPAKCYMIC